MEKKGGGGGGPGSPGVVSLIAIPIPAASGTTVSTTSIPANAVILRTMVDVTTAWGAGTLVIKKTGGITLQAAGASDPTVVAQYDQQTIIPFGTASTVEVVGAGLAGAGVGVAYIEYALPGA